MKVVHTSGHTQLIQNSGICFQPPLVESGNGDFIES